MKIVRIDRLAARFDASPDQVIREIRYLFPDHPWIETDGFVPAGTAIRLLRESGVPAAKIGSEMNDLTEDGAAGSGGNPPGRAVNDWIEGERQRGRILLRREADWAKFDIAPAHRDFWTGAGISRNRAHVAAICRASMRRDKELQPQRLLERLDGATGFEALAQGENGVVVRQRLARVTGHPLTGASGHAVSLIGEARFTSGGPTRSVRTAYADISWSAEAAPTLAVAARDALQLRVDQLESLTTLLREIRAFRESGRIGELLEEIAEAHGIFGAPKELADLCDSFPKWLPRIEQLETVLQVVDRAVQTARDYFVFTATAARRLRAASEADHVNHGLVTTSGVAFLYASGENRREIAFWCTRRGISECVVVPHDSLAEFLPMELEPRTSGVQSIAATDRLTGLRAARIVNSIAELRQRTVSAGGDAHEALEPLGCV